MNCSNHIPIRIYHFSAGFAVLLFCFALPLFSQPAILSNAIPNPGSRIDLSALLVSLPAPDLRALQAEDSVNDRGKGPFRFGYNNLVNLTCQNSGTWTLQNDGSQNWTIELRSEGAQTLNLAFDQVHLPRGATLLVCSPDHKIVQGPFTSLSVSADAELGTDVIKGESVLVEYHEPPGMHTTLPFRLFRVTHGYRSWSFTRSFGQAGACIPNIHCPEGAFRSVQSRSVLCVLVGGNAFCTATLVNNSANDQTPYVLTANHCGKASGSWVFRFNWEAPGCDDPPVEPDTTQFITGAQEISASTSSDFQLCLLNSPVPASFHAYYAGWNATVQPADSACCIQHPSGDIKKAAFSDSPVLATVYDGIHVWQTGPWRDGCTEQGSSGAPLFDPSGRIIGQLAGGPSACWGPVAQDYDCFGSFAVSWNTGPTPQQRLSDWLDPLHTGSLVNEGFDPLASESIANWAGNLVWFYPNPAHSLLNLQLTSRAGELRSVEILNSCGKKIRSLQNFQNGTTSLAIELGDFEPGLYLFSVRTTTGSILEKIVKE